jgi:tetratricopeptide (TPR) repeat protein
MQYREAIDELNVSIGLAPDLAIAYNARGFARLKLGDYARAIEDLDRAIRLNPNYTDAYRIRRAAQNALGGR